jgi:uncharacterized membrane protein YfcA
MTPVDILTLISGVVVGFTLGVIGGGGSILPCRCCCMSWA